MLAAVFDLLLTRQRLRAFSCVFLKYIIVKAPQTEIEGEIHLAIQNAICQNAIQAEAMLTLRINNIRTLASGAPVLQSIVALTILNNGGSDTLLQPRLVIIPVNAFGALQVFDFGAVLYEFVFNALVGVSGFQYLKFQRVALAIVFAR